jgi:hypothetical protein
MLKIQGPLFYWILINKFFLVLDKDLDIFKPNPKKMPQLKLQSSDGEIFQVEAQIAKQSNTIRTMLEGSFLFM